MAVLVCFVAAITKYHRLGSLKQHELIFLVLDAGKSKIKVLAYSVPDESLPPSLQIVTFSLCPHMVERESTSSLVFLLFFFQFY